MQETVDPTQFIPGGPHGAAQLAPNPYEGGQVLSGSAQPFVPDPESPASIAGAWIRRRLATLGARPRLPY